MEKSDRSQKSESGVTAGPAVPARSPRTADARARERFAEAEGPRPMMDGRTDGQRPRNVVRSARSGNGAPRRTKTCVKLERTVPSERGGHERPRRARSRSAPVRRCLRTRGGGRLGPERLGRGKGMGRGNGEGRSMRGALFLGW